MIRKSCLASVLLAFLAGAAFAGEGLPAATPDAAPRAEAAPLFASVLDQPADCARPQNVSADYDPDVCSPTCGSPLCRGLATYAACGGPLLRSCLPNAVQICSDGPVCHCLME